MKTTTPEDVEAHINGNHVPRWLNTRAEVRQVERDRNDACNGNCAQGRMCDCVPDVSASDTKDADQWDPLMSSLQEWALIGVCLAAVFAACLVLAHRAGWL